MVSICFKEKLLAERRMLYLPVDTRIDIQNVVRNGEYTFYSKIYDSTSPRGNGFLLTE